MYVVHHLNPQSAPTGCLSDVPYTTSQYGSGDVLVSQSRLHPAVHYEYIQKINGKSTW